MEDGVCVYKCECCNHRIGDDDCLNTLDYDEVEYIKMRKRLYPEQKIKERLRGKSC